MSVCTGVWRYGVIEESEGKGTKFLLSLEHTRPSYLRHAGWREGDLRQALRLSCWQIAATSVGCVRI